MPRGVYTRTVEHNRANSLSKKGLYRSPEHRKALSKANKGRFLSATTAIHMSIAHKGLLYSPYHRNMVSRGVTKAWQNPEIRNRTLKAMMEASHARPNNAESLLGQLIDTSCPSEYQYSGNGSYLINGMCPDFFNTNGQKKVIELYGDYWHQGQNPQERIDKFAQAGFGCLVIWEHELKNHENIIAKIREFNDSIHIHYPMGVLVLNKQLNMFDM